MKIKKITSAALALIMTLSGAGVSSVFAEEEPVVLSMAVANKVEVALAIGPTTVDYSTFEKDLREALQVDREHPIPQEDVYILASKAVSANTTSEFNWWEYDHTRPAASPYNGVSVINDATRTYVEYDASSEQTGSAMGAVTTAISSSAYTPDPTNPDIGKSVHPYRGIQRHMIESNSGATMDFYGYSQYSYKDFRILPNDQKTIKTFEFAIAEDLAFDALDGAGFFFNVDFTGSYAAGTQLMSGYLLFLAYNTSGVGSEMAIYKFSNVNVKNFHHSGAATSAGGLASFPGFVKVASSAVYLPTQFSRKIKIEVAPNKIQAWYKASTLKNDASVLNVPIDEAAAPVVWTMTANGEPGQQSGTTDSVILSPTLITSYGFGPMCSYIGHGCARPTHMTFKNLTMTVEVVKTLTEVVREPEWHENTLKYLVNLNEHTIKDFEENAIISELLARVTNDDIYYIGWGSTENAAASAAFLRKHSLKGTIIDIDDLNLLLLDEHFLALSSEAQASYLECIVAETGRGLTYEEQIRIIADEIYKRYWNESAHNRALITDNVIMSVTGADTQNTADVLWPGGKWRIDHDISETGTPIGDGVYMTNFEGLHPRSGQYMSDLEFTFNLPGTYTVYFRDVPVGRLVIHRKPVASFEVTRDIEDMPEFTDTSYDPDVYDPIGINGTERGILTSVFSWIDLSDPEMLVPVGGVPDELIEGHDYIVTLTVEDDWGACDSVSRLITYTTGLGEVHPPFAEFTLTPVLFLKSSVPGVQASQKITLTNNSYDPAGLSITSDWTVLKDDLPYGVLIITEGDFVSGSAEIVVGTLPAGDYKIILFVNNGEKDSAPVAKYFSIVEDLTPPTAAISPTPPATFTGNTNLQLTFSDTGGSEFKEARFAITQSPAVPVPASTDWKPFSGSVTRSVLASVLGPNYVHWEALDNAGNASRGTFGPYRVEKATITMDFTAEPQDGISSVYNMSGKGVTLTAIFTPGALGPNPTGTVFFYQGSTLVGGGTVGTGGVASWTGAPLAWGNPATFTAEYGGNSYYADQTATDTCVVEKNPRAEVIVGPQTDRHYDATRYVPTDIWVTGGSTYKVEYVGRDGTIYPLSEIPPANAGKYTVIVTTDDESYEEKSDSADFEILKRELALLLETDPETGEYMGTVTLMATITNAVDLPPGRLEFWANGSPIGVVDSLEFVEADYNALTGLYTYTAEIEWEDTAMGEYNLTLRYAPSSPDNYIARDYVIRDYSVGKAGQTISFLLGASVTKTYGDADFFATASGGVTAAAITYSVVSGTSVVSVDPDTGEVTILGAGSAVIRALKPGDDHYNPATADIEVTVNKKTGDFSIYQDDVIHGDAVSTEVVSNESGASVTYTYEGAGGTVYGPSPEPPTEVGSYMVTALAEETANYESVSASETFDIVPCPCEVTGVIFEGAAIHIPYYSIQQSHDLTAEAEFIGCGRPGHNYNFEFTYEIETLPVPRSAAIDEDGGRLVANVNAAGGTVVVKVTATHVPTGYYAEELADFPVTKDAKPTGTPGDNAIDGSGIVDKNESEWFDLDISAVYPRAAVITVDYIDGPAADAAKQGTLTEGVDYVINDGVIEFSSAFIGSLHAGDHEFLLTVDGDELTFYLYVAFGDVIAGLAQAAGLPDVAGDTAGLEEAERENTENADQMNKGYNVYLDLIVSAAGETPESMAEKDLINAMAAAGKKTAGIILDITLKKSTYNKAPEFLKETDAPVTLIIDIPPALMGRANYTAARAHTAPGGGMEFDFLPSELISGGTQMMFSSDKFSTFAILYDAGEGETGEQGEPAGPNPPDENRPGENWPGNISVYTHPEVPPVPGSYVEPPYMAGYPDGLFRPEQGITRAEVAQILYNLYGNAADVGEQALAGFRDAPGHWAARALGWAVTAGYLVGYGDGTLRPDNTITRAELSVILCKLGRNKGLFEAEAGKTAAYSDVEGHWAYEYIAALGGLGIEWNGGEGEFLPDAKVSRAEAAVMFHMILKRRHGFNPGITFSDVAASYWAHTQIMNAANGMD